MIPTTLHPEARPRVPGLMGSTLGTRRDRRAGHTAAPGPPAPGAGRMASGSRSGAETGFLLRRKRTECENATVLIWILTERKVFMLLLNIQSSPRGAKSASIAVTNAFLD